MLGTNYLHLRAHEPVPQLRARERAHGQRPARPQGQPDLRREAARFRTAAASISRSAYQETDSMSGLTHSTGVTLAPNDRWNFGANTDIGTLTDSETGAEIDRHGRRRSRRLRLRVGAVLERRRVPPRRRRADRLQRRSERTTWLFRNNFKYQLTPGLAPDRQAQLRRQREFHGTVLRRRVHGGRARLRLSAGPERPAQGAGQVHVLLQRSDDRAGDGRRTRRRSSSRRVTSRRWI